MGTETPQFWVAIYARVSTAEQKERDLSVRDQVQSIEAFCAVNGWPVVGVFKDEGISGGKQASRKEFMRMLNLGLSKKPPFDLILTRDQSRFGRGDYDAPNRAKLRANHVRVDSLESPNGDMLGDGITPQGKMMERLKSVMDISQREEVPGRVIASQRLAVRDGRFPGSSGTCFGYRSIYEGTGPKPKRRVELDPDAAPAVREMFRMYAAGDSLHVIARWLNESQVATARGAVKWYAGSVRRLLRNETVLGRIVYGRLQSVTNVDTEKRRYVLSTKEPVRFENAFEPLVSQSLFNLVNERLAKNERNGPKGGNPLNLVRGLTRCKVCGWGLAFQQRSGNWYYLCEHKKQYASKADPRCSGCIPKAFVDDVVFEFVGRIVSVPNYQATLRAAVETYNRAATEFKGISAFDTLTAKITKLERERENLVKGIKAGGDIPFLVTELKNTNTELAKVQGLLSSVQSSMRVPPLDTKGILDAGKALHVAAKSRDAAKVKALLPEIISKIEVDLTLRHNRDVTFSYARDDAYDMPDVGERLEGDELKQMQEAFERVQMPTQEQILDALAAELSNPTEGPILGASVRFTTASPLLFIAKWDLSNLERVSEEALRRIGGIAS